MDTSPDHLLSSEALTPYHSVSLFQRRRPLFWLALAFCAGIIGDSWAEPRVPALGGIFLAVILGNIVFFLKRWDNQRWLWLSALSMALSTGMLAHALRARIPSADDISRRTSAMPSFVWLRGMIVEAARPSRAGGRELWTIEVEALGADAASLSPASGRVQAAIADSDSPSLAGEPLHSVFGEGDTIELRMRIESPPDVTLPETFDYRTYLLGEGIRRVGQVFPEGVRRVGGSSWLWRPDLLLRRFSAGLAARVETLLTAESLGGQNNARQAALLNALLFGRRERVDISDRETFAISGTAHLLAISGLQIHFLAFLLMRASGWLGLTRRKSAALVLIVCCAYCALSGAASPVLRATIMISLYLGATAFWREADPLSILGASALITLAWAPAELFNAGWQLSFLAVLALSTLYPALDEAWTIHRKSRSGILIAGSWIAVEGESGNQKTQGHEWREWFFEYCRKALFVSLAATLGTAPVVAWHMGRFSTLTFALNLFLLPLGNLCMVLALMALAASLFSSLLATVLSLLVLWSVSLLEWMTAVIASIPFAAVDLPPPTLPILLVYAAALTWVWIERGGGRLSCPPVTLISAPRMTFARLGLILPACLLMLNAAVFFRESVAAPSVTILDLKMGRAALVQSPSGGAALIDAGGAGQGSHIAEMLRRQGIGRLSLLVISADDRDAMDGVLDLLKRVSVQRVLLPRAGFPSEERREVERFLTEKGVSYGSPNLNESLRGPGEVRWDFCDDGPAADAPAGLKTSLSVRISLPGTRILFVAARSASALKRLMAKGTENNALQADVMRLTAEGGKWQPEVAELIRQCGCQTLIAGSGSDAEEGSGVDLAAVASAHNIQLLSPHREGSLRVQADVGGSSGQALQAFRDGVWRDVR